MKGADMSILRVLNSGLTLMTSDIAYNSNLSRSYTQERLRALMSHGLVEVEEEEGRHPRYRITDLGRRTFSGNVDISELED